MEKASIVITGAALSPNPVLAGETLTISVEIVPVRYVLGDDLGMLVDHDGCPISVGAEG